MQDNLGDRMKMLESAECGRRFMPLLPIVARIDGRCFSKFTRGMDRPYDARMSESMNAVTKYLVEETNALMGYTQSDEITLVWHSTDYESQIWFDGRIHKMVSQLGALATLYFFQRIAESLPEYASRQPTFDARVWQLPTRIEAANAFLWREWDATKNSLTMAASHYFSHGDLHDKNGTQKYLLLKEKGVDWEDYPSSFKRGTYVQRHKVVRPFTAEEISRLPPKHQAHSNPNLTVERQEIAIIDMPPLGKVGNREAVIFEGAQPVLKPEVIENRKKVLTRALESAVRSWPPVNLPG